MVELCWQSVGAWRVCVAPGRDGEGVAAGLVRVLGVLPASGESMLLSGRHRVDRLAVPLGGGMDGAVKTYGRQWAWRDAVARWKGTKAARAFAVACRLSAAGVGTPEPLAVMERWEGNRLMESRFLTRFVPGLSDFRVELNRLLMAEVPCCADIMALLQTVADAVRGLHAAGVLHGDLGNQNIALVRVGGGLSADAFKHGDLPRVGKGGKFLPIPGKIPGREVGGGVGGWRVLFLDLNRAVVVENPTSAQRGRDLARLDIPSDLRRCFFAMYSGGYNPPPSFCEAEGKARRAFTWHTRLRPWRHPVREARIRRTEADLPHPPTGRELWIWDERSGQPIPAYTARDRRRFIPARNVMVAAGVMAARGWKIHGEARVLAGMPAVAPDLAAGLGISLEADRATWEEQNRWLVRLADGGVLPVQLRVYHHVGEAGWRWTCRAARRLHEAGHSVALTLTQSRKAVVRPESWRRMLRLVFDETADFVEGYHVLQAPNRTKWGIWDYREIPVLLAPLREERERHGGLRLYAPGCIDFEPHALAAVLAHVPGDIGFAGLSHALYVDRRGAPENLQGGYDTARKCALLRAFARHQPGMGEEVVITEVNWPLCGTGVYSPVSSPYETLDPRKRDPSVGEDVYAEYMVRYIRMVLGSGHVRRLYWWRLAAHGFGLVDVPPDGSPWRARPAFSAFAALRQGAGGGALDFHVGLRGAKPRRSMERARP